MNCSFYKVFTNEETGHRFDLIAVSTQTESRIDLRAYDGEKKIAHRYGIKFPMVIDGITFDSFNSAETAIEGTGYKVAYKAAL